MLEVANVVQLVEVDDIAHVVKNGKIFEEVELFGLFKSGLWISMILIRHCNGFGAKQHPKAEGRIV